jgi:hypothetical protein
MMTRNHLSNLTIDLRDRWPHLGENIDEDAACGPVAALAFDPAGETLAVGVGACVLVFDVATTVLRTSFRLTPDDVTADDEPRGPVPEAGSLPPGVVAADAADHDVHDDERDHHVYARSMRFSPDGALLAVVVTVDPPPGNMVGNLLMVYDRVTRRRVLRSAPYDPYGAHGFDDFAFAPGGRRFALSYQVADQQRLELVDPLKTTRRVIDDVGGVLAFGPEGHLLVADARAVRVYDDAAPGPREVSLSPLPEAQGNTFWADRAVATADGTALLLASFQSPGVLEIDRRSGAWRMIEPPDGDLRPLTFALQGELLLWARRDKYHNDWGSFGGLVVPGEPVWARRRSGACIAEVRPPVALPCPGPLALSPDATRAAWAAGTRIVIAPVAVPKLGAVKKQPGHDGRRG